MRVDASCGGAMVQGTVVYEGHGSVDMNMWEADHVGKKANQILVD